MRSMSSAAKNPEINRLVSEIENFRAANGMTKTGFGLWAKNDPNLIRDLEAGREPRWSTVSDIRKKMASAQRVRAAE